MFALRNTGGGKKHTRLGAEEEGEKNFSGSAELGVEKMTHEKETRNKRERREADRALGRGRPERQG